MKLDKNLVLKISHLAKIPVSDDEADKLLAGFNKTLEVVDELFKVDIKNIEPLHQTTLLENVFRDDVVDEDNMLSQDEALSQAKNKYNGYFVVNQILEED
ncbi:MAG: Asp-tRNA(Asn)/Glu-tRNA(Gln) amidotransferase subunit GatC [Candidatus Microgenomates bacterium]